MSAYSDVIEYLRGRKRAYQLTFQLNQPANIQVMTDLAKFCRAAETCAVPGDHDKTMMLEGRREVWLRIQQHLQLEPDVLFDLYGGNAPKPKDQGQ